MNAIVDMYRPTWATCSVCGLTGKDVTGTPPRCEVADRCRRMLTGQSLGGAPLQTRSPNEPDLVDDPPRRPFMLPPGPPPEGSWRDFKPPTVVVDYAGLPWEEEQFLFQQRGVGVA